MLPPSSRGPLGRLRRSTKHGDTASVKETPGCLSKQVGSSGGKGRTTERDRRGLLAGTDADIALLAASPGRRPRADGRHHGQRVHDADAVSYTHLTLPTKRI